MISQGNFERTKKVEEKSGNLKINCYPKFSEKKVFCRREKDIIFHVQKCLFSHSLLGGYVKINKKV